MHTNRQLVLSIRIAQILIGVIGAVLAIGSLFLSIPLASAVLNEDETITYVWSFLVFAGTFAVAMAIVSAVVNLIDNLDGAIAFIRYRRLDRNW